MPYRVTVRSLQGETTIELSDGATAADVREVAGLAEGSVLRQNGSALADGEQVESDSPIVASPPEAKHGLH